MLIKVTQSHIDRGCRGDGSACPVALALRDALGCWCHVDRVSITIGAGPDSFSVPTPPIVEEFIIRYDFDVGADVEPFEFELDVEGVE